MDIEEAIYQRRTIRRFKQDEISMEILKKLIDFARLAPMGNNIQSLEYIIVENKDLRERLFECLSWAGSLPPEMRVPEKDRRPTAYILVIGDTTIKETADSEEGAAVENILLGAVNFGIASCWMGAISRNRIKQLLNIPDKYRIMHVISLGYPDETSKMEPFEGSFKYWKEGNEMHVPKRKLDDIILKIL